MRSAFRYIWASPSLRNSPSHECQESFSGSVETGVIRRGGRPEAAKSHLKKRFLIVFLFPFSAGFSIGAVEEVSAPTYHGVFRELPGTNITPEGWLAEILRRQRDGLALNRKASGYPYDTDLWIGKLPQGQWKDYEQTAYFLDGTYRCGLLLKDKGLTDQALANIDFVLDHPEPDGKLGPTEQDYGKKLGRDEAGGPASMGEQWPFAVFTRLLMAHYEATKDQRVIEGLARHYQSLPKNFGMDPRDVMNVEGLCWLYRKTGDRRFLDLAERTWENSLLGKKSNALGQYHLDTLASGPKMRGHGVTVCEQTKLPALLYMVTGRRKYLDASLGIFRALARDHEQADGVLSSDAGLSGKAPDHSHETCVIIDYSWSLGYLTMASGDPRWADTAEKAVLNAGLSAVDREFKSHQYYATPNQMSATQTSSRPTNGNRSRPWQAYRPDHLPACCTGNLQRMLPTYVGRMWMTDGEGGLAAVFYGPNTLEIKVGAAQSPITIHEKTGYPFDGVIEFRIATRAPVEFPLALRIPDWAEGAKVSINGKALEEKPQSGTFFTVNRTFADGDVVTLDLPMTVRLETPVKNAVTVARGPLVFALGVKENRKLIPNTLAKDPDFPAWDLSPASAWNYALAVDGTEGIRVNRREVSGFPWTQDSAPVTLTVPAKKIPSWVATPANENPPLPEPPFELAAAVEEITLIPYGLASLRVSVFPTAP